MYFGRDDILNELENKFRDDNKHLIVLYGKRRNGKTSILKEFAKNKNSNFFICTESISKIQLESFSNEILKDNPLRTYISSFENWEKAFEFLLEDAKKEKKLLIIDEIPYLGNSEKSILSIIQKLWDQYEDSKLMCIFTGSSLGYMEKNFLEESSPLYGRLSLEINVEPLDIGSSINLLNSMNIDDPFNHYLVFGSIPRYLKLLNPNYSLADNIKQNFVNKYSILNQEIKYLVKEDLREPTIYFSILNAISNGYSTIKDIQEQLKIEKTKINVYLKHLIFLSYVEKLSPLYFNNEKENKHLNRYHIKDNIINFYFKFIYPNQSSLEIMNIDDFYASNIKDGLDTYLLEQRKIALKEILISLNKNKKLPTLLENIAGKWDNNENYIPAIGINDKEKTIITCNYLDQTTNLIEEIDIIKRKTFNLISLENYVIFHVIITDEIRKEHLSYMDMDKNILFIDLKNIFRG